MMNDVWKKKYGHKVFIDGWINRWMDGWIDGWIDGWMDGWWYGCRRMNR